MGVHLQARLGCPSQPQLHRSVAFFPIKLRGCVTPRLPINYPNDPQTLGKHLRRRRLDLGLKQRVLADRWGICAATIEGWEADTTRPQSAHWPRIIEFLGFDPCGSAATLPDRLEAARRNLGLTRTAFAKKVGLDPGSICHWVNGDWSPSPLMTRRIEACLATLEGGSVKRGALQPSYLELTRWRRTPLPGVTPSSAGERIRARRLECGLSQAKLGKLVGVRRSTIGKWEATVGMPSAEHCVSLRDVLGVDVLAESAQARTSGPLRLTGVKE